MSRRRYLIPDANVFGMIYINSFDTRVERNREWFDVPFLVVDREKLYTYMGRLYTQQELIALILSVRSIVVQATLRTARVLTPVELDALAVFFCPDQVPPKVLKLTTPRWEQY